jgi:hypothetical protein
MASSNTPCSAGAANAQITTTKPAVMSVIRTQPGTSPRSEFISFFISFLSLVTGLQNKKGGKDCEEDCDREYQKDGWDQHLGFVLASSSDEVSNHLVLNRFR